MPDSPLFLEQPLLELSFDRYQRFRAVAELINGIQPAGLTVLNLCDADGGFVLFAPDHHVISVVKDEEVDVTDLPYRDAAFDAAVCIDILEHVPGEKRRGLVSELWRIARYRVIIAAPFAASAAAEELLYKLTNNPYLREHIQLGLPDRAEFEVSLLELGLDTWESYPNACLNSWTAMLLANHLLEPEPRKLANAHFNRHFYRLENREPSYRTIYVLNKTVQPNTADAEPGGKHGSC